jgi:hypothetical protein
MCTRFGRLAWPLRWSSTCASTYARAASRVTSHACPLLTRRKEGRRYQEPALASEVAWVLTYLTASDQRQAAQLLEMGVGPLLVRTRTWTQRRGDACGADL